MCGEGRVAAMGGGGETKVLRNLFIIIKSLRGEIQQQQTGEIKSKLCGFTPPGLIHTTCASFCVTCAGGGGGVLCTVRNVGRHQLVVEATRRNLVMQLVSLSDLSADKPAGSCRPFGIRQHDTQLHSALAAHRRASGAANNYGIKAAAVEPNNMM